MEVKLVVVGGKQAGKEIPVRNRSSSSAGERNVSFGPRAIWSAGSIAHLGRRRLGGHRRLRQHQRHVRQREKIQQRQELNNGDRIKIGMLEFDVRWPERGRQEEAQGAQRSGGGRPHGRLGGRKDDDDISSWLRKTRREERRSAVRQAGRRQTAGRRFTTQPRARHRRHHHHACRPEPAEERKENAAGESAVNPAGHQAEGGK